MPFFRQIYGAPFWGLGDPDKGPAAPEKSETRYTKAGKAVYVENGQEVKGKLAERTIDWNQLYCPDPWQTAYVNGQRLPGRVEVTFQQDVRVDQQKAAGSDGARSVRKGINPAKFDMRIFVWTPDQFTRLQQMLPKLWTPTGKPSNEAVRLSHPTLNLWRIDDVYINGVQGPMAGSVVGEMAFSMHCEQWHKQPVASKKKPELPNTGVEPKADIHARQGNVPVASGNFTPANATQSTRPPSADANFSGPG